ncbi:acetyl esterase/lipase [Kibdelosporangium banguiense]|uniref:Acetyl esterase/lipase n=1 Tax=Kibdelosporangium banguiense TaxID=1365924 RepID=A0ABS4TTU8_9PSEU|nr:alpha/beta hydrolase [Kibdelosporangium banguiense]MBP2327808.1 acetyl esterase/lipase [Kibdelosporangium banguiense]
MPSVRAHLLSVLVRMGRVRNTFDGAERIGRSVASDRTKGPATPSAKFMARFSVRETEFAGRRVHVVGPRSGHVRRRVLYLHGGGWVLSISDPHWGMVGKLAERLDCSVTVPMFPLAPEHHAREMFAMLLPLYAKLVAEASVGGLTVMGDSTGGNLALSLVMQARAQGLPQPDRLVLISPCLDVGFTDPATDALDRKDPISPARGARELGRMYAGDYDLSDPVVSPLFGSLDGLAPIAIFTGTRDILNADAHRLKQLAAESGIPLIWHEYPGMLHVWPLFPLPEASRALDQITTFITEPAETSIQP